MHRSIIHLWAALHQINRLTASATGSSFFSFFFFFVVDDVFSAKFKYFGTVCHCSFVVIITCHCAMWARQELRKRRFFSRFVLFFRWFTACPLCVLSDIQCMSSGTHASLTIARTTIIINGNCMKIIKNDISLSFWMKATPVDDLIETMAYVCLPCCYC